MNRRRELAKMQRCALQALEQNASSFGLDMVGLIPGASTAAILAQLGIEGLGMVDSAVRNDMVGVGSGAVAFQLKSAEPLAAQYVGTSSVARAVPIVGGIISAYSLLDTFNEIREDFNGCMGSK